MQGKQIFRETFVVSDPYSFSIDPYRDARTLVEERCVGKCFKGCFITAIADINKVEEDRIDNIDALMPYIVHVEYEADVITYRPGWILPNIKLENDKMMVTGRSPDGIITANVRDGHLYAIAGDYVPIMILKVYHSPREAKIAVSGQLWEYDSCEYRFRLDGKVGPEFKDMLIDVYELVIKELEIRQKMCSDDEIKGRFAMFEKFLFPYKNALEDKWAIGKDVASNSWVGPNVKAKIGVTDGQPKGELLNILDIAKKIISGETYVFKGYYSRPLNIIRSNPIIMRYAECPEGVSYAPQSPENVISHMIGNTYINLVGIRGLVETFNSEELIQSHHKVWEHMQRNQK